MDFNALFAAFLAHPGACVAVVEALAVGYLFRELMKAHTSALDISTKIAPVAEKLGDGVIALERILERSHKE